MHDMLNKKQQFYCEIKKKEKKSFQFYTLFFFTKVLPQFLTFRSIHHKVYICYKHHDHSGLWFSIWYYYTIILHYIYIFYLFIDNMSHHALPIRKGRRANIWTIAPFSLYVLEDGLLRKYLVITPQKSKWKNFHRKFCLSKQ